MRQGTYAAPVWCEACGHVVDPDEPRPVAARVRMKTYTLGCLDFVDGPGVVFHERCWSDATGRYVRGDGDDRTA